MGPVRSLSINDIDPRVLRQVRATLEEIDPKHADDLYAQLWNHPDLFERIAEMSGTQMGAGDGSGMQGSNDDLAGLMVEYALRSSDRNNTSAGRNLGSLSAPQGGFAATPTSWNGAGGAAGVGGVGGAGGTSGPLVSGVRAPPGAESGGLETAKKLASEGRAYGDVDAWGWVDPNSGDAMNCSQFVLSCYPELMDRGIVGAPSMQTAAKNGVVPSAGNPPAAGDVITSAAGSAYGHVGIMGDDGMVYHSVPGKGPTATPYEDWIKMFPPNGSISMGGS